MLLKFIALSGCALLLACRAQAPPPYFYCDSNGTAGITEADFYLVTRREGDPGYPPGLMCEFIVQQLDGNGTFFIVEILSFQVSTAVLTVTSDGRPVFRGSEIRDWQRSMATPTPGSSVTVRFDSARDDSNSSGVTARVRVADANGCPPGWALVGDTAATAGSACFGLGGATQGSSLSFVDAQLACNSMRSNLLAVPAAHRLQGGIGAFLRSLSLRDGVGWENSTAGGDNYTWIGLTDRTRAGRFAHYWLDGTLQNYTSEIGCVSCAAAADCVHTGCHQYERCAAVAMETAGSTPRAIFMDRCNSTRAFACYMPPGGADVYFLVPDVKDPVPAGPNWSLIWGLGAGSVFVVGLSSLVVYCVFKSCRTA